MNAIARIASLALSPAEKWVLAAVFGGGATEVSPGLAGWASAAGMDLETTTRIVRRLVCAGVIAEARPERIGRGARVIYRLIGAVGAANLRQTPGVTPPSPLTPRPDGFQPRRPKPPPDDSPPERGAENQCLGISDSESVIRNHCLEITDSPPHPPSHHPQPSLNPDALKALRLPRSEGGMVGARPSARRASVALPVVAHGEWAARVRRVLRDRQQGTPAGVLAAAGIADPNAAALAEPLCAMAEDGTDEWRDFLDQQISLVTEDASVIRPAAVLAARLAAHWGIDITRGAQAIRKADQRRAEIRQQAAEIRSGSPRGQAAERSA